MGVLTNLLKLLKPGENDYYNQQTEQADNWDKVDNYAVLTNTDKNGVWGGEYGGKIQDPIPKELNKRYIDNINGKAFICIKAGDSSVVSNTIEYFTPCNVVDNLNKLQNLSIDMKVLWQGSHSGTTPIQVPNLDNYCAIIVSANPDLLTNYIIEKVVYRNLDSKSVFSTVDEAGVSKWEVDFIKNTVTKVVQPSTSTNDTIFKVVSLYKKYF